MVPLLESELEVIVLVLDLLAVHSRIEEEPRVEPRHQLPLVEGEDCWAKSLGW